MPTLRPPTLRALRNVVESQTQVQNQGEENESEREESKKNFRYLRGQARNWLAMVQCLCECRAWGAYTSRGGD